MNIQLYIQLQYLLFCSLSFFHQTSIFQTLHSDPHLYTAAVKITSDFTCIVLTPLLLQLDTPQKSTKSWTVRTPHVIMIMIMMEIRLKLDKNFPLSCPTSSSATKGKSKYPVLSQSQPLMQGTKTGIWSYFGLSVSLQN